MEKEPEIAVKTLKSEEGAGYTTSVHSADKPNNSVYPVVRPHKN